MIKHIFLLTWNKRKQHIFLITELFLFFLASSFLAFALSTANFFNNKQMNFSIDNLVEVRFHSITAEASEAINQSLLQMKAVKSISHSNRVPYQFGFFEMPVILGSKTSIAYSSYADEYLQEVLGLKMLQGRWFSKEDLNRTDGAIIINRSMSNSLFKNRSPIHQTLQIGKKHAVIVGVCEDLNDPSEYAEVKDYYFIYDPAVSEGSLLVKLKIPLNEKNYKEMEKKIKEYTSEIVRYDMITPISQYKERRDSNARSFITVLSLVSGFLVVNIILGLYSTLHQAINKRRAEIGIRRTAGATSANIYFQIVMEVLALTTLSLLLGIIAGYQFMLFDALKGKPEDYVLGMTIAAGFIYLLVILCALYPAYLAARIHPADALHDD